jgi:hypothetical protein
MGYEYSPARRARRRRAREAQEARWAARSGPVVVTRVERGQERAKSAEETIGGALVRGRDTCTPDSPSGPVSEAE